LWDAAHHNIFADKDKEKKKIEFQKGYPKNAVTRKIKMIFI
jgi:hypothetical protein